MESTIFSPPPAAAAQLFMMQPDEDPDGGATLPCQLSCHLLSTCCEATRAPALLAIARITVALTEHLGASREQALLESELMQALAVAIAKPVVSAARGLCRHG